MIDLKGQEFSRLTVIARVGKNKFENWMWKCRCKCGRTTIVASGKLRSGHTRSCGCLVKEAVAKSGLKSKLTHGHASKRAHTGVYSSWHAMIQRCTNPKHRHWKYYGGRGIKICKRWMKFENFLVDMGERPKSLSIDRKSSNGNYQKSNCRWATTAQQRENQSPRQKRKVKK